MKFKKVLVVLSLMTCGLAKAYGEPMGVGETLPLVKLDGKDGERVGGGGWSSDEISQLTVLFYIDPDERAANEPVEAAFKKENFPPEKLKSVAVINLAASWVPNSILNAKLEAKQKEFPNTVYVKDYKRTLVKAWDLADESVNLLIITSDRKVAYLKKGPLTTQEISDLMQRIRSLIL